MRSQYQVVSVPSSDTAVSPVILLSFDDKRYLFNCGESTQRQLIAQKIPLRKIQEIFLTHGWESHGGLAGLLLGISDSNGLPQLGIHGPQNLAYFLATLRAGQQRGYKYHGPRSLSITEYASQLPEAYKDSNVIIQPILSFPDNSRSPRHLLSVNPSDKPSRSMLPSSDLVDPQRIMNIALSVWSGQFLERQEDGSWSSHYDRAAQQQVQTDPSLQMESGKRTKRIKIADDTVPERPSAAKHSAFMQYMQEDLPPGVEPFPAAVSYFIEAQPLPGKFDPKKAKELGISPGPAFGKLQKGTPVTNAEGLTIQPAQVMGPPRYTDPVLILACPTKAYVGSLVDAGFWKQSRRPSIVIHCCNQDVLDDSKYKAFIEQFGSDTKHRYCLAGQADTITLQKHNEHLAIISRVLDHQVRQPYVKVHDNTSNIQASLSLTRLLQFTPYPSLSVVQTEEPAPVVVLQEEYKSLMSTYDSDAQTTLQDVAKLVERQIDFVGGDVEIGSLGTGSAGPSNYRNVAATMIRDTNGFCFLLDCGEGTVGQMKRCYGKEYLAVLRELRLIYISHLHADHHLGLIGLVREWVRANAYNEEVLFIIVSTRLARSLIEYANIEDLDIGRISFIDATSLLARIPNTKSGAGHSPRKNIQLERLVTQLPMITSIRTVEAIHTSRAMCFRLDHRDGWSVAYSGDTRPCEAFVELGRDVTCLIHEATFGDDKLEEAVAKKHSTIREAESVAQKMNARTTLLTHFSQRYPKIPPVDTDSARRLSDQNIGFGTDLMRTKLKDVWKIGLLLRPVMKLEHELQKINLSEDVQSDIDLDNE